MSSYCHHTKLLWCYSWYSLCCTFYPHYLFILSLEVCISSAPSPASLIPSPALSSLGPACWLSPSFTLFLFYVHFLFCFVFQIPYVSEIIWYLSFSIWPISFSIYPEGPSMLLQMATFHSFYGWVVFHWKYICYIFFIHSSADGHLGGFHILTFINNAAVKTGVHVCFLFYLILFFFHLFLLVGGLL